MAREIVNYFEGRHKTIEVEKAIFRLAFALHG